MDEDRRAAERARWRAAPRVRPDRIEVPGPGQESVWDFPRPPRVEPVSATLRVVHGGAELACSVRTLRVIETSGAPVYYFPPGDVRTDLLVPSATETLCEWKGVARHWSTRETADLAWSYPEPDAGFEALRGFLAFHAARVDACWVDDERVRAQPGGYYGGWITSSVTGPFKGGPGSERW